MASESPRHDTGSDDKSPSPRPSLSQSAQPDKGGKKPTAEPVRKDDDPRNNGELSSSQMQEAGVGEDEGSA